MHFCLLFVLLFDCVIVYIASLKSTLSPQDPQDLLQGNPPGEPPGDSQGVPKVVLQGTLRVPQDKMLF